MITRIAILFGLLLSPAGFTRAADVAPPSRPNILLVFIDDMGWTDLSCFGNQEAATPQIDRMAAEGLAFEQFYVNSPICSPSRVAISTGQYPQRWGITSYLARRELNEERGLANWLDPRAPMLARSLHRAGYATGHFGKWHMGGQRDIDNAPPITAYGFDASLTNFEGMGPKLLPLTLTPGQDKPQRIWADAERLGGPVTWKMRCTITGGYADAALHFIARAEQDGTPFYVNLWPDDVHTPLFPSVARWDPNKRKRYLGVLEEMDAQFGPVFEYIRDRPALRDNTLILICSDNGPEPGAGNSSPLKGCKTNLYEGGTRSPLIAWGPGLLAKDTAGTRNHTAVFAAIDLAPSLLKLAGVAPPSGASFDGEDLLDTLLGRSDTSRHAPICFSRPPDRKSFFGYDNLPDLAIRQGDWKLLCDYDGGRPQLYHLVDDPSEAEDLAADHPDRVQTMTQTLTEWYTSVTPASPTP